MDIGCAFAVSVRRQGQRIALVEGARMLAGAADGILPWRGRPAPLKRGLIARVPPLDFHEVDG